MAEFERQVEELSGRVSSLMEEKRSLESRNSLLERVVQLSQETGLEKVCVAPVLTSGCMYSTV